MNDPTLTQLGTLAAPGLGQPIFAVEGDHACAVTVQGAGSVSATVAWQGSADGIGWVTLATLSPSGTNIGTARANTTESYRYWRLNVTALTGTSVTGSVVSESGGAALGGPYAVPRILVNSAPNITLNDTSAGAQTTLTPFAFWTIPGGLLGPNSVIRLLSNIDWVGGNSKSVAMRIGPASGTFATATGVAGQSGLSNQLFTPQAALIGNDGVTNRQRSTPANASNWFSTSAASGGVVTSIDTSLDWNIWIAVQFGLLNGGDTATLRRLIIELLP